MGTSRNDPSPDVPSWRRARAMLGDSQFSPSQQGAALWQAAVTERSSKLIQELSDPMLVRACAIADQRSPAVTALRQFDDHAFEARSASVTLEFARRALARAATRGGGSGEFAAELFGEITGYYASRDLPSIVATPNRVRTVSESIRLADAVRGAVRERVQSLGDPGHRQREWVSYVRRVLGLLRVPPG